MSTKQTLRSLVLLAITGILPIPVSIAAAQIGEGGILNGNAASKGKAIGSGKKEEGRAATAAGNKLSSISEEIRSSSNAKPPDFSVKGLPKKKTAGWLRTADGAKEKVGSTGVKGVTRPKRDWYNEVAKMFGGEHKSLQKAAERVAKHAEGQAAGLMHERGIQKAWLDINNNYVCEECRAALSKMLRKGSELIVRYWDDAIGAMKELPPLFGPL